MHTWKGVKRSFSPSSTRTPSPSCTIPCSSVMRMTAASMSRAPATALLLPTLPPTTALSPLNVFEPASTVAQPGRRVLTTVARMKTATSCSRAAPNSTCMASLNTYVPARTSVTPGTSETPRPVIVPPAVISRISIPSARSFSARSTRSWPSSWPASSFVIAASRSENLPRWVVMPSSSMPGSDERSLANALISS